MQVFISYSHRDANHLENFKKHLITLERNKLIETWCDKELIPGDLLDREIRNNLLKSDVIIFLISVDFLNSYYCYEKELLEVINNIDNSAARIVPVIVRDCDWQDGTLDNYTCITYKDFSISNEGNEDAAWLHVVNQLKTILDTLDPVKDKNLTENNVNFIFQKNFSDSLNITSMPLHHRIKGKLTLDDIYVYPQLKKISDELDSIQFSLDSKKVLDLNNIAKKTLIIGDEQSGKTALSKMLMRRYHDESSLPVYIDSEKINKSDVKKILKKILPLQYESLNEDEYFSADGKKIVILDNFHNVKLNEKSQGVFLDRAYEIFDIIILFADNITRYFDSEYIKINDFEKFELLAFGHKLKGEIVDRWNSMGREETLDLRELHTTSNVTIQHLNSIVRKNILDSKPVYLLIVLQSIDSAQSNDYSLTSYGHCYQYIITQNFEKANVGSGELDTLFNYMTELAFFIYKNNKTKINGNELNTYKKEYSKKFFIKSHSRTIKKLIEAGILNEKEGVYSFCYKYIYYFYIAKYIAEHINEPESKSIIEDLCNNLHVEKNANILIFITHHSKDESIIEDIFLHVSEIFNSVNIAKLDLNDTKCLQEFIDLIPEKVYKQRDVSKERVRFLEEKDKFDVMNNEGNNTMKNSDEEDGIVQDDILLDFSKSIKSIDLIGQILRNRYGSLTKTQLLDLGKVSIDVGLRLLKFHLDFTEKLQREILFFIEELIRDNGKIKDEYVIREAKKVYLALTYGISYGIIRKISSSIGSDAIISLMNELRNEYKNSPAFRVLEIAVKLDFTTKIPKTEIESILHDLSSIPITKRLLRDTIIQHAHLHHTDYKDKQWITNILNIPMNSQRLIDLNTH